MKDGYSCRCYCITGSKYLQQEKRKGNLVFILFKDKNYLVFFARIKSETMGK